MDSQLNLKSRIKSILNYRFTDKEYKNDRHFKLYISPDIYDDVLSLNMHDEFEDNIFIDGVFIVKAVTGAEDNKILLTRSFDYYGIINNYIDRYNKIKIRDKKINQIING